jgi:BspA type Leucine rich repeat region (6 copies)
MARNYCSFMSRGVNAAGESVAGSYLDAFQQYYQAQLPFDFEQRKIYFFPQSKVISAGGEEDSVMLASYSSSENTFESLSSIGVPANASIVTIDVNGKEVECIVFPKLPILNTLIGGLGGLMTKSQLATTLGISVNDIKNFIVDGSDIYCAIMVNYSIPANAFKDNTDIIGYIDALGLIYTVGDSAFEGCALFEAFESSSCFSIGVSTFEGCVEAKTYYFPSLETAGNYAFLGNTKVATLELPVLVGLTTGVCTGCIVLSTLTVPTVTQVSQNVVNGCTALDYIALPSLDSCDGFAFSNWAAPGKTLDVRSSAMGTAGVVNAISAGATVNAI